MFFRKKKEDNPELKESQRIATHVVRMRKDAWAYADEISKKLKEKKEKVVEEKKTVKLTKIKEKLDALVTERVNVEFGLITDPNMKMPKETPVKDVPPPELCYQLDQYGKFTEHPTTEDEDPARYWRRRHKAVGIVLLLSGLILAVIIINNSPLADIVFNALADLTNSAISFFMGLFV